MDKLKTLVKSATGFIIRSVGSTILSDLQMNAVTRLKTFEKNWKKSKEEQEQEKNNSTTDTKIPTR